MRKRQRQLQQQLPDKSMKKGEGTRTAGWDEGQKKPYTGDVGKLEQQNHSWLPIGCPCPISVPGLPSAATKSVAQPGSCSFG